MTPEVIAVNHPGVYVEGMANVLVQDDFGSVLRDWRTRRNRSQLALATEAGVSQRHISFLETGRSKPSREMVIHLGLVLDVPLRDRNAMLVAAGFAPAYTERSIDDPDVADIRRALQLMLQAHNPFPAYVMDRHWNVVMLNDAAARLVASFPPEAQALAGNLLHLTMYPNGIRSVLNNWGEAAAAAIRRLAREVADAPADLELAILYDDIRSQPGAPTDQDMAAVPGAHDLLVPLDMTLGDHRLSLFTTIATLGSPNDVTMEELRLETLLPANTETEEALRAMAKLA